MPKKSAACWGDMVSASATIDTDSAPSPVSISSRARLTESRITSRPVLASKCRVFGMPASIPHICPNCTLPSEADDGCRLGPPDPRNRSCSGSECQQLATRLSAKGVGCGKVSAADTCTRVGGVGEVSCACDRQVDGGRCLVGRVPVAGGRVRADRALGCAKGARPGGPGAPSRARRRDGRYMPRESSIGSPASRNR